MSDEDRYIPGVPCWIDTNQPDPAAAVAFYGELFGWEFEDVNPPEAPGRYHVALIRGGEVAAVGSQREGAPQDTVWNTYVRVVDADETAEQVRAAGGTTLVESYDAGEWGRMAVFADPDGAAFSVWQAKQHGGAAIVNEHGALNFNDLNTRDLDRARAFYGAVFGWDVLEIGAGSAWALPGYGDFLEQRSPGMRAGMKEMGAPERFEDVVASVRPTSGDTPPHWGVTFAVDDPDAIAERAAALGGEVLTAPLDRPWVRMTVIADPQGATFTASKFLPENKDLAGHVVNGA